MFKGIGVSATQIAITLVCMGFSSAWAANYSTNGYHLSVIEPEPQAVRCEALFRLNESALAREATINGVLTDWHARGDYKDESLEKLKGFESTLDPQRTTWITYQSEKLKAAVRMYDGTRNALPMERKFPGVDLHIRAVHDQPIFELGLMDVQNGVDDGVQSLFHQVAKILKRTYLDRIANQGVYNEATGPVIVATARPANARLYQSRYGFEIVKHEGQTVTTPDGMIVMRIPLAYFVSRYFGSRIYPRTRGEKDYWGEFFKGQNRRVDSIYSYAAQIVAQVQKRQYGDLVFRPSLDPGVDMNGAMARWTKQFDRLRELLKEENFKDFETEIDVLAKQIWSFEPVMHQSGSFQRSMGTGPFRISYNVPYESWDFRFRGRSLDLELPPHF